MMKRLIDITKARIYVTTEKLYASGDHFGEWMELSNYNSKKEFEIAFRRLYQADDDPEIVILLWQDVPRELINIKAISSKIFHLIKAISDFDRHMNRAFHLWLDQKTPNIFEHKAKEIISLFEDTYLGYFPEYEAFGKYYAKEFLAVTSPKFNYVSYARQLLEKQFIRINGYVFKL